MAWALGSRFSPLAPPQRLKRLLCLAPLLRRLAWSFSALPLRWYRRARVRALSLAQGAQGAQGGLVSRRCVER